MNFCLKKEKKKPQKKIPRKKNQTNPGKAFVCVSGVVTRGLGEWGLWGPPGYGIGCPVPSPHASQ